MEPTNRPFGKENDLPNLHEDMFQPLIFRGVSFFFSKTPQVFLTLHFHLGTSRIDAAERSSRSRVPSAAAANTTTPRGGVAEMGGQGKKACVCFFFFWGGG